METPFSIAANPDTDVWKKPPKHDVFNAPYLTHSRRLTTAFRSASLTFACPYATQFDQAGLLFIFHPPSSHLPFPANNIKAPTDVPAHRKWIKAGVELFDGAPRLSTVCCDNWADWSVASLPRPAAVSSSSSSSRTATATTTTTTAARGEQGEQGDADAAVAEILAGQRPVTITVEREKSDSGCCLWVYHVDAATGARTPMREINWPYGEPAGPGWELEVAAAVARPSKTAGGKLEATFTEFVVDWA
ncbi:hypothetical protein JDV02_009574 [Purpureocillium takamizusanense]|uniref:Uncharacterized protein n=1 Tax=Purpureocillium takamizusanense TaxID=2060973 RepID=A0A9Q8QS74_9HYPO|nr:uncharacterized protein JDV02_009574 [Purpureocillium takamizusanense]UNI23774.1 hypothetical protein JDV02_009574 [Purpureocillium takamizusanense]